MLINSERLAEFFKQLCEIDSLSRREGHVAIFLKETFFSLGADVIEDNSAPMTGSETGNLIIRFPGNSPGIPVFFNAHMDTVVPGDGVRVRREGDIFHSFGDTVLGGDDKSGIAILVEVMRVIKAYGLDHGLVEFVFTTCEEIGLLGAKNLDAGLIQAKMGYALDSSGTDQVIVGAPAANRFTIDVVGVAAHAGLHPEHGVSAIQLAAESIGKLHLGRLDGESTANIGLIQGGTATNIVPERVRIEGEVRSHSVDKLEKYSAAVLAAFEETVTQWQDPTGLAQGRPSIDIKIQTEYPAMLLELSHPVVRRATDAAARLGYALIPVVAGGGSDANIFNGLGLHTVILGTGMSKVHTTDEFICLSDMVRVAELVLAIITTGN